MVIPDSWPPQGHREIFAFAAATVSVVLRFLRDSGQYVCHTCISPDFPQNKVSM